jgi:DNA adenine methylase
MVQASPFLKWVGGKRALLPLLLHDMPKSFETYFEPFLGGGAVFFALSAEEKKRFKKAILSDANEELVNAYIAVRDMPEEVLKKLHIHAGQHDEQYYYDIRSVVPKDDLERAARFIYLNKTCYNGLWRVNKKGQFNVPMGTYANPRAAIVQEDKILACSKALQGVTLLHQPYQLIAPKAGDFVYIDPPYAPLNSFSFTRYHAKGFNDIAQTMLREAVNMWASQNVRLMLSNSNADIILELYKSAPFHVKRVQAPRSVNSKGQARGMVEEVLITTYVLETMDNENSFVTIAA